MNSKLHTVTDAAGRPLRMFLIAGQRSDYIGARALLNGLPPAEHMLADRGYDADWYREALEDKGIISCVPSRTNRKDLIPYNEARYRKRHKIETSFARLKDWRHVAPSYDRCPKVFLSACALAAVVMFWLSTLTLINAEGNSACQVTDCARRCENLAHLNSRIFIFSPERMIILSDVQPQTVARSRSIK